MNPSAIQWVVPSPLWAELASPSNGLPQPAFHQPAILRFATDDFMQDFFNVLATDPRALGEFRAVRETWRGKLGQPTIPTPKKLFALPFQRLASTLRRAPKTGDKQAESSNTTSLPNLKLYQPAHLRYYLVSACLTCATPGLPDRKVDAGKQERVSFVARRLLPPPDPQPGAALVEYAWIKGQTGYSWQLVDVTGPMGGATVAENEERLPLFPATFQDDDKRSRRVFAGLIPVAKREAYLGAQITNASAKGQLTDGQPPGTTNLTALEVLLRKQVIEPWKILIDQMSNVGNASGRTQQQDGTIKLDTSGIDSTTLKNNLKSARERAQVVSWLLLLDFAKFLSQYLPDVWNGLQGKATSYAPNSRQAQLVNTLTTIAVGPSLKNELLTHLPAPAIQYVATSMAEALTAILPLEATLDGISTPYQRDKADADWPGFLFPLADADPNPAWAGQTPVPNPLLHLTDVAPSSDEQILVGEEPDDSGPTLQVELLGVLVIRALAEYVPGVPAPQPDIPVAALPPDYPVNSLFQLRCVYERPACGPGTPDVVSDPTDRFEMAAFFDPDAPARPIRIGLPIDTTPAGLRKFDKNTAFAMSDVLCGQVNRARGMTFGDLVMSVLPWPFHKDLPSGDGKPCTDSNNLSIGMICSLSIPIITICAFILLMIMVTLFDIIFSWMCFFAICFPLPGFKGKKP